MTQTDQGLTVQLRESAEDLGDSMREQAAGARDRGTRELRTQLDARTTQAGQQARSLARELRRTSDELEAQGGSATTARLTTGIAERLERAGTYLEHAQGDDLLRDAERFARQRPWFVAGAAAAAGFLASRFLKASSERRYEGSHASSAAGDDGQAWVPPRAQEAVTSMGYPAPPTVTVGPPGTTPAH